VPNLEGLHSRGPDRGSPKPDQHRRSGFGIRHAEEGGPELPRLLPLPQGEDPLVHGQCGETDLPLLRLRRGGKCLLLPDEDRQHDVSGGRASPGRETGHRPSRPGLHTGGKIPPRFTGKPGPGEPGGRRLLRQNAADGCGLGGTGLPRKKGTPARRRRRVPSRLRAGGLESPAGPPAKGTDCPEARRAGRPPRAPGRR